MDWPLFIVFLAASVTAASNGQSFPPDDWYAALRKPAWTPPNWLFPVAWTFLYVAMAVAAARVAPLPGSALAVALWALQIALNSIWTPLFFGRHRIGAAAFVLGLLWLAVAATMLAFFRLDTIAGWLFVPYLAWVSTAFALNLSVWRLNRA